MKKMLLILLTAILSIGLLACAPEEVILECDGCGKSVSASTEMDNSWVIYCEECQDKLFG